MRLANAIEVVRRREAHRATWDAEVPRLKALHQPDGSFSLWTRRGAGAELTTYRNWFR
jgi:hypothetical protein